MQISFFKKRSEKEFFLASDKRFMAVSAPQQAGLKVVLINKLGKRTTYPVKEMINSWLEIDGNVSFYISRRGIFKTCEVEFAVS